MSEVVSKSHIKLATIDKEKTDILVKLSPTLPIKEKGSGIGLKTISFFFLSIQDMLIFIEKRYFISAYILKLLNIGTLLSREEGKLLNSSLNN